MYCKRSGKVCKSGGNIVATRLTQLHITIWNTDLIFFYLFDLFSSFYWAKFDAQRERAQQDFKVPYKVPHLTHPPFTYERQQQHRDHRTLIYE